MSKYIPPPKDPNYLKRKIYTRNTIKVTNETNPTDNLILRFLQ